MHNLSDGVAPVYRFIASRRAVHVWYNLSANCGGVPLSGTADGSLAAAGVMIVGGGGSACHHGLGTLVTLQAVRGFSSVIVVIDKRQVHGMTYGQLAAYVAPVGLAQVYPDAHDGAVPTILWLSQGAPHPPQHLTAWDRALLYGLYNTNQASGMQLSEINLSVLRAIER